MRKPCESHAKAMRSSGRERERERERETGRERDGERERERERELKEKEGETEKDKWREQGSAEPALCKNHAYCSLDTPKSKPMQARKRVLLALFHSLHRSAWIGCQDEDGKRFKEDSHNDDKMAPDGSFIHPPCLPKDPPAIPLLTTKM